jgi:hypothetical protein
MAVETIGMLSALLVHKARAAGQTSLSQDAKIYFGEDDFSLEKRVSLFH